ncbi:MAG: DNA polymerase I [Erysipelotrichaceae bacterium]
MKKMLLVDGNSMLFRAYYATLYGRSMTTSNGIPTNAIIGFANMLQKALELIKPDKVFVAWDSGKPTFRHIEYPAYKGTRKELDQDLIVQFSIVREYLDAYGIFRYECDGIEADDIIGTMAKIHPDYQINILSSDKDLLQLIDSTTNVYLMKKGISEIDIVDEASLKASMGITPHQVIELKGLMGDTADNIPGVKGVGEKTALKLLAEYESVEGVYEHIDELKGKLKERLIEDKENAFLSKHLATIITDAKIPFKLEDLDFKEPKPELIDFYAKYEMNSFIRRSEKKKETTIVKEAPQFGSEHIDSKLLQDGALLFLDIDNESYYETTLFGIGIKYKDRSQYIHKEDLLKDQPFLDYLKSDAKKCAYDIKSMYHAFSLHNIEINQLSFDIMIAAFLVDGSINDYQKLADKYGFTSTSDDVYGKKGKPKLADEESRLEYVFAQLNYLYPLIEELKQELISLEMMDLFNEIEIPLAYVLFEMERNGVTTDLKMLDQIASSTLSKIEELSSQIYAIVGFEFNINSPKQLASVLFDELGLKANKKRSTAVDVLEKLASSHPVIPLLMEQRKVQKLYSTYAIGLSKHVLKDGKIHTIFNQCLTQTGRLSSSEPNLQNISVRDEAGKEIRKAFVASSNHILLAADYSQIELRMLAHMADEHEMIHAFNQGIDIHSKTAMEIFDCQLEEVTSQMRRSAKTVNFGIVYGQSEFGLSEQLSISRNEAKLFIEKYFASYPNIKKFMDETITFCEANGYVKTLFNRRRTIKEIHDKNYMMREFGKRAAMNAPIQGSAADLIKKAMILVFNKMKEEKMKSTMILQIHDELIFDCELDEVERMKEIVEDGMCHAMELKVPLIADASVGNSWFEAK